MIHFSCDCCGRSIDTQNETRYVVRMEVYSSIDTQEELADERDHLEELEEILERLDAGDDQLSDDLYQQARYDLCGECREKFLQNPLGRLALAKMDFSEN